MALHDYLLSSSSGSSDEDEENYDNYMCGVQKFLRDNSNPFELPEARFVELFRFPQPIMQDLCNMLQPHLSPSLRTTKIPSHIRVLAAMYFFATGSYQRTVGQSMVVNLSQSQISCAILEVSEAIVNHISRDWIKFPDQDEYIGVKHKFMENWNMPGIIGVVDGTHIAITTPTVDVQHNYYNRKRFHSKNVLIVCDSEHRILTINARHGGATHDAFIWRGSNIRDELQTRYINGDSNSWLLGDSGFMLEPFLMTPIRNAPEDSPESRYNSAHRSARSVVERCIGILKSRFRCILKDRVLKYNPQRAGTIITACAVLHNISIFHQLPLEEVILEPQDDEAVVIEDGIVANANIIRQEIVVNYFRQ